MANTNLYTDISNLSKHISNSTSRPRKAMFIDDHTKTIIFSDDPREVIQTKGSYWLPAMGYNITGFDGHIYLAGATDAGKSYFIKKMVSNDKLRRPVILFTDLSNSDESLHGIDYTKYEPEGEHNLEWVLKHEKNKIIIFDDVQFNKVVLAYRDTLLEKGRHMKTTVICVNHRLQDYAKTKVPLNDARYVVTFPCTNRGNVVRYLKNEFELDKKVIDNLVNIACNEGEYLIIHKHYPIAFATKENIIKMESLFANETI